MRIALYILTVAIFSSTGVYAQELKSFDDLFRQGKYSEAAKEIETLIQAKGSTVPSFYYFKQAEVYYTIYTFYGKTTGDQLIKSYDAMSRYIKSSDFANADPDKKQVAGNIARECYKKGAEAFNNSNFALAQECFTKAAEVFEIMKDFSDIQKLWYFLAVSCHYNNDKENALKYFSLLADHNYRDQNVYLNLSDLCKAKGDNEKSIAVLKKLIEFYPENKNYYELIMSLYEMNDKEQALDYIRKFNSQNRYDTDISLIEGSLYYEKNQTDSALTAFKRVVKNEPDHISASFNAGIILYNSGLQHMKTAEQKYYEVPEKYNLEKDQYLIKIKEAVVYLENAYKYDKDNKNLILCLADIYKRLQRNAEYESLQNALKKMD
jgi:tetratricopeptide (TPR) repeat protein